MMTSPLSGSSLRHQVGNTTEFARALTILECPARRGTHVVVPLFGMVVADSTGVAVLVYKRTVAGPTEQFTRTRKRCGRLETEMRFGQRLAFRHSRLRQQPARSFRRRRP